MNHRVTHNSVTPPFNKGGDVMLRQCYGCYVTCYAVREVALDATARF